MYQESSECGPRQIQQAWDPAQRVKLASIVFRTLRQASGGHDITSQQLGRTCKWKLIGEAGNHGLESLALENTMENTMLCCWHPAIQDIIAILDKEVCQVR